MKIRSEVKVEFGKRLQKLRRSKGLSQIKLAEIMGTHFMTVSRWERGIYSPYLEQLIFLAEFFEVSIDYLIGKQIDTNTVMPENHS